MEHEGDETRVVMMPDTLEILEQRLRDSEGLS